jgi:hypothetical protein
MAQTSYDVYVKDSCSATSVSPWSGPYTFTTLCNPALAPYTESFDGNSTPACWSQSAVTGGPWAFSTGSGVNTACGTPSEHTGNGGYFSWMDFSSTDVVFRILLFNV